MADLAGVFTTVRMGLAVLSDAGPDRVSVRRAVTAEDLDVVLRLRAAHHDGHLLNPGLDAWDRSGLLFVASARGLPVGTVRCTLGAAADLPEAPQIARFADLLPAGATYVSVARLVIAPHHRHFGVTAALAMMILTEFLATRAEGAVAITVDSGMPYYRRLGFRRVASGEYSGRWAHLVALDDVGFPTLTAIQALIRASASAVWHPGAASPSAS